jgi:16S rRNA (uracil1498-N3)-methyltransferase
MHRFYVPRADIRQGRLRLEGREAHHARHVLRLAPGHEVTVLEGSGTVLRCRIEHLERDALEVAVLERTEVPRPQGEVTLLQAIPKGSLFDSIVQKSCELAVSRIVPLITERVISRFDEADGQRKAEKWRLTAVEAIKQCGAAWLPEVTDPLSPEKYLATQTDVELPLLASLQEDRQHPRAWFQEFVSHHGRLPNSVSIWIGPEGDFTPAEVKTILAAGAKPISLGPLVLRAETAALAALAVVQHELRAPLS